MIEEYGYKGRETMREKVFSCLEKWHMTEPGMRIVVGLSGGADSVALLLLLSEYREKGQIEVEALHVHHGIRGETADRDQAFCEAFCRERKTAGWRTEWAGVCTKGFRSACVRPV